MDELSSLNEPSSLSQHSSLNEPSSLSQQGVGARTVIDLRTGRSGEQRILELAAPGSDPGWIAGLLNREGLPSPTHRPWSPEDVLAVLASRTRSRA